jgi:hypothetical protein
MGWEMLQSTLYEDQDYFWGYMRGWRDHSRGVSAHPLRFLARAGAKFGGFGQSQLILSFH